MSSQRPLVAHVIHRLAMGGMENGLVNLINGMDPRFDHAIVCMTGYTDFRERLIRPGVPVVALDKQSGLDPAHYGRLWRTLRLLRPAIVHTRNIGTIEAAVVARLSGVATVIHGEHGYDVHDLHGSSRRYRWLRRYCGLFIRRFVCVSEQISDWLRDGVGIKPQKLLHIYNGVDSERFNPARRAMARRKLAALGVRSRFVIGSVGRLEPVKNPLAALEAYAAKCRANDAFREHAALLFIGSGALETDLRAKIAEFGLGEQVHLLGARDDVAELLPGLDVFVLPSLNEGISNTILEAMASGVPVLASRVGGNPELVVDGVSGRLYPCADLEALGGSLLHYFFDDEERARHAGAARERVLEHFSLRRMIGDYEDIYAQYC